MNAILNFFKHDGSIVEPGADPAYNDIYFDYAQIALLGKHACKSDSGNIMLVSRCDLENILKFKWYLNKSGYPATYGSTKGKLRSIDENIKFGCPLSLHHLLYTFVPHGYVVDHINRDRMDNRRENLRICTALQNSYNKSKPKNSNNRFKGVRCSPHRKKHPTYVASITKDGVKREIKNISTEEQAALIYDAMAEELFGEYAAKNFPSNIS